MVSDVQNVLLNFEDGDLEDLAQVSCVSRPFAGKVELYEFK